MLKQVVVNGHVVFSPRMMEPLAGGILQISGDFGFFESIGLVARLR